MMSENPRPAICACLLAVATCLLTASGALAQPEWDTDPHPWRFQKDKPSLSVGGLKKDPEAPREFFSRPMDVQLYHLQLEVTDQSRFLRGTVDITLEATEELTSLDFDFSTYRDAQDGMTVLAARVGGTDRPFDHENDVVSISPVAPVASGATVTVSIDFEGSPSEGGFFGYRQRYLVFASDPPVREDPVLETLSEPDGARHWWPCHDTPADAAQVRLTVVGPELLTLAAPGLREVDELIGGGLRRQEYWMPAPIPSYLVSLNMADFVRWEETTTVHTYPDETEVPMMLEFFSARREEAKARATWDVTAEMLGVFEDWFGPYPFAATTLPGLSFPTLKYGMSMFTFGGGMEHPTLSTMGQFTVTEENDGRGWEWIVAHELAHQWFGDCTRVERWGEIWLNEGFASYCEVLWLEHRDGPEAGLARLQGWRRRPVGQTEELDFSGPVRDPVSGQLFGTTVYRKGGWLLHQIRQVLGKEGLLAAMRSFVMDPELRFQAVSSADFQRHCEMQFDDPNDADTIPGDSLDWFFEPWLQWEGRPSIVADWSQNGDQVRINVQQPAARAYRLPLTVRLELAEGKAPRDVVTWIDATANFQIEITETADVTGIQLDPDDLWLLDKQVTDIAVSVALFAPFPNPLGTSAAMSVPLFVREGGQANVAVYDLRGRHVRTLFNGAIDSGRTTVTWNGADEDGDSVASGTYFLRLEAAGDEVVQRVTVIR